MSLRKYHWYKPSWREKKKRRLKKLRRHLHAKRTHVKNQTSSSKESIKSVGKTE
jgi:cytochrome c biogenesis protein ResB